MQSSVHGRADGVSIAVGDIEEEPEVQSGFSAVEEVATYNPEDHSFADGDGSTQAGSCCESTTTVDRRSTTDDDDDTNPAKQARIDE